MSWITIIPFDKATGKLKTIYNRVKGPNNQIDNVLGVHSLRPHTLTGHMSLYKNVLHHSDNTFDNWFLELVGTYTSYLNQCDYCYVHHFTGMKKFLNDDKKAEDLRRNLEGGLLHTILSEKETALIEYSKKLTLNPSKIEEKDIDNLKSKGVNEGEILEINQVVAYFNYANRTVLGLGVETKGEVLGLSPKKKETEDSWYHE